MDLKRVRLELIAERERQGLNQRELATRAGIDQGHLSKIENVDGEEMRDLAARIVFQVIERGLKMSLSSFFAQIEALNSSIEKRKDRLSPPAEPQVVSDAASPVASSAAAVDSRDIEALGRGIGRSIAEELRRDREREAAARASEKPKPRRAAGTPARRRR